MKGKILAAIGMQALGKGLDSNQSQPEKSAVDLSVLGGPRFILTVDTEEEFNWHAPFDRNNRAVTHLSAVPKFHALCKSNGIKPIYLVDWPVVVAPQGAEMFRAYAQSGEATVGTQLHPWVCPPFTENVTTFNSYACNLPAELEREKLAVLTEAITEAVGIAPFIYRAGRYGIGRKTPRYLKELGYKIDTSVRARFSYTDHGGPDFTAEPVYPYMLSEGLLELPLTTVFKGGLQGFSSQNLCKLVGNETVKGILAKTRLLNRISLTPEGIPLGGALNGIDRALEEGIGLLNFSFHSPSLVPGHTPYVRNADDLKEFYAWWHGVFAHLHEKGVCPVTAEELAALV